MQEFNILNNEKQKENDYELKVFLNDNKTISIVEKEICGNVENTSFKNIQINSINVIEYHLKRTDTYHRRPILFSIFTAISTIIVVFLVISLNFLPLLVLLIFPLITFICIFVKFKNSGFHTNFKIIDYKNHTLFESDGELYNVDEIKKLINELNNEKINK